MKRLYPLLVLFNLLLFIAHDSLMAKSFERGGVSHAMLAKASIQSHHACMYELHTMLHMSAIIIEPYSTGIVGITPSPMQHAPFHYTAPVYSLASPPPIS